MGAEHLVQTTGEGLGLATDPAMVAGEVGGATAARIEDAVNEAFLGAFRLAIFVAASLALASAVAAALIIEGKGRPGSIGYGEKL